MLRIFYEVTFLGGDYLAWSGSGQKYQKNKLLHQLLHQPSRQLVHQRHSKGAF
ncbi:hypothetical protein QN379_07830 [Glaciimonas sp. Gout2]|uniref:hypothetical protein n=1 Tax=unclassified Glaciimonas TaxID=2644401 RepID=UPI002AB3D90B|nr:MULTISPECIES: hypothetical protein [unclassified Glaciimonas]MDY7549013.1 hypothetical protein [Glaciimonas sp. CA11.2]MEB0013193.1 hypothetical protein [Glaciimonas sp. Cout2]MEB0081924.1 hypothetical protein [Glaciimonas sp. Gout2]